MATVLPKVNVVTTGMGWAGGIVAAELTKAGYNVVGLERGEERSVEDYLLGHDELKYNIRKELMQKLNKDTLTFRNTLSDVAKPVREENKLVLGTGTGGGGAHWGAQAYRYFPYDFEIRSKTIERYGEGKIPADMTIQDWGLTYDEIEPYYTKYELMGGISGEPDPLGGPRSADYPTPPLKMAPAMKMFKEAADELGYHPYIVPTGNVSEPYTNPDGEQLNACQYCSFCGNYGCEYGAKTDPIVTVIPTAQKTGKFELRPRTLVTRILKEGNTLTGVRYIDLNTGEEFDQPADVVALTSYIFNNVRLLLLSEIGEPYNPETGTGIIGKNYTDHHTILGATGYFDDKKFNNFIGTGAWGIAYNDYNADNFDHSDVDFIHGGQIEMHLLGNEPIANNPVIPGTPTWGKEFKKNSLFYYNRTLTVVSQRAFLPYKDNYLSLDPTYKDEYGDPLLRVTFDYKEMDFKRHEYLSEKCVEVLNKMGATTVVAHPMAEKFGGSFTFQHDGGGAIMGESKETSAVNNYLQMWDYEQLFVIGSSAFPHFGPMNPTPTMGALSYRAAEGIINYLKNGGGLLTQSASNKAPQSQA